MANRYLMAVDAGTGSVRAVLFDQEGAQLSCVQREWTHAEDPRYPGSMDFDWAHNWELASECIRGARKVEVTKEGAQEALKAINLSWKVEDLAGQRAVKFKTLDRGCGIQTNFYVGAAF